MEAEHGAGHVEPLSLPERPELLLGEQAFAHELIEFVERPGHVEVGVHHGVEQRVEQEANPVDGKVGRTVPALEHWFNAKGRVLAHGDEPATVDEHVHFCFVQPAGAHVDTCCVTGEEQVRVVPIQLGSLAAENVLYRELVQRESGGQAVELLPGRVAEVNPQDCVRQFEAR